MSKLVAKNAEKVETSTSTGISRIAIKPRLIPAGVSLEQRATTIFVKGPKGQHEFKLTPGVLFILENNSFLVRADRPNPLKHVKAMIGTTRRILENMIIGVSQGFQRKLLLKGVGYRAAVQNDILTLSLGYSHPVLHKIGADLKISLTNPTEIVIEGIDKQKVGQEAADIRRYRAPERYKGKGIRYDDENIIIKEVKKK